MRRAALASSLFLGACGGASGPALELAVRVDVREEQGIDYSGTSRAEVVVRLDPDGAATACRAQRSVGVYGTDAHVGFERVAYAGTWRRSGEALELQLRPTVDATCAEERSTARDEPLVLRCVRDERMRFVPWRCAIEGDRAFELGLAIVQNEPEEGRWLLLGETPGGTVDVTMDGQGQEVTTVLSADPIDPRALRR